ncbi:MAG TPA: DUF4271 domain-containing protein [Bacteroidales bacterium]|nr:DUF4271 domain-containing protein [Bacteroidales bacterium]
MSIYASVIDSILSSLPVIERHIDSSQIIICVSAIIILLLLLTVKLLYHGYFKHVFLSVFRSEQSIRGGDDNNNAINQASILTGIMALISTTTAVFSYSMYSPAISFMPTNKPIVIYFAIFVIVLSFTTFYRISLFLLGWIIDITKITISYSNITSNIFKIMGLIIFPFFFIATFSEPWLQNILIYSILIIVVLAFAIRLYNFLLILFKIKFLNHYAILYFCVFEILPVLIVVKIAGSLSVV